MKHICWYQGKNLKCKICFKYPWSEVSSEFKIEKRPCLANYSDSCKKYVKGHNGERICDNCYKAMRKVNLI